MRSKSFNRATGYLASLMVCWSAAPKPVSGDAAPPPATRHELWVPSQHLAEVLKKHPQAVVLDARQYEALIRDAGKVKPLEPGQSPVAAVVGEARVKVSLPASATSARVEYVYQMNNLRDGWCEAAVPLPLPLPKPVGVAGDQAGTSGMQLVDLEASKPLLLAPPTEGQAGLRLLAEGRGTYEVRLVYQVEVAWEGKAGRLAALAPRPDDGATVVSCNLPEGSVWPGGVERGPGDGRFALENQTVEPPRETGTVRGASLFERGSRYFELTWFSGEGVASLPADDHCVGSTVYRFFPERLAGATELRLNAMSPEGPGALVVTVPQGVQVLGVRAKGKDLIWKEVPGAVQIESARAVGKETAVNILFEQPLAAVGAGTAPVSLPVLRPAQGVVFRSWKCAILAGDGVQVRFDDFGAQAVAVEDAGDKAHLAQVLGVWGSHLNGAAAGETDQGNDTGIHQHPGYLAAYAFDTAPAAPVVRVGRSADRFSVDMDLVVTFSSHEARLARKVTFHGEAGTTSRALVELPANESFLGAAAGGHPAEWKQVGRTLEVHWPKGLEAGAKTTLEIRTRQEISTAAAGGTTPDRIKFGAAPVTGAARVSGYVALAFDESWKVMPVGTTGLEVRDVMLTPVKGRMAWYCLKEWELEVELVRRAPVYDAAFTAYALPRASQVELEGQLELTVSGAPLRKFEVKLPPAKAPLLRMVSPLIGAQELDEASGVWQYTLRRELMSREVFRFRMSLPATVGDAGAITTALPEVETPGARRRTSAWVIEANTDTEIEFTTRGVQPLDSLRPPVVQGYAPRHRIIAAYGHSGGGHEITMTARRHAPAEVAGAVVMRAGLTTVLAKNGAARHEAAFILRHNGRQFITIGLPPGAVLLTSLIQDLPVKPVLAGPGEVRLALPVVGNKAGDYVEAKVVYETEAPVWGHWGKLRLEPPKLADDVPVLASRWRLLAPEGYTLRQGGSGLEAREDEVRTPMLLHSLAESVAGFFGPGEALAATSEVTFMSGGDGQGMDMMPPNQPVVESQEEERPIDPAGRILVKARRIIIPVLKFDEASLADALEVLEQMSRQHDQWETDPVRKGINLLVSPLPDSAEKKINLDLKAVPFIEALGYVTELGGVKFAVMPNGIAVGPLGGIDRMYSRSFRLPLRTYLNLKDEAPASTTPTASADAWGNLVNLTELLKNFGVPTPEGSQAVYDLRTEMLTVKNTQENSFQLEALLESLSAAGRPKANDWADIGEPNPIYDGDPDASRYYAEKMDRIVFPSLKLEQASIDEAIETLRLKSKEHDRHEEDPTKKGVNFVIKSSFTPSTAKISLDLTDVPMSEALRYVTELAGMKYRLEPYAVVVEPLTDTASEQYTRTYSVPPNFPNLMAALPGSSGLSSRASARDILVGNGISLPEGATAVFVPSTSQLIVRNTLPNLDQLETFIGGLRRQASQELLVKLRETKKSGLVPVMLELAESGQVLELEGNQGAERLTLHFVSWEWQMARTSVLILLGAWAFRVQARSRPWAGTLAAVLVLGFLPQVLFPTLQPSANALLFGWLVAAGVYILWKTLLWLNPPPGLRSPQAGEEAAV